MTTSIAPAPAPAVYGRAEPTLAAPNEATRVAQQDATLTPRFYTTDFKPAVYTPEGLAWIEASSMKTVLLRHYPELADSGLTDVSNAFMPWE